MTSMLDEDGLRGGGVWGLLVLIAVSLSWPASLSASLPLRGGVRQRKAAVERRMTWPRGSIGAILIYALGQAD